ncbi:MAG: TIGR03915 family putative DNA repair protein [Chlorobium sp.]|jgi:probable DNA metabolism protein|uniref:TIGR03915 family putative DNA repair protein n=1 Tax=Chlorobium sp. TaxID=1095 RepID=UPI001E13711A|nr:TIGR03915 family putative DNA repair protein [Chlorobium sp.]MBN1278736.1 TIGR03915 family putative DNA repair protein [Chlorobiaceae bacterium]MCF8216158.1 TIGR03915 family putative DNA repair protein [Chlorobium sp.]MCF8271021.1 TIGR03915 family putative DNA repair protein [Chlorobium sp.]MCF8287434.1 TIGR03915 family putative DNA repair protein [Chlorobium sp.]MCF8290934.1 TIGR03915 family putative DNA repair protein [Chlorobium sp.]
MSRYLYDGTVEGLLSVAARMLAESSEPEQATLDERQNTLFEDGVFIETDAAAAEMFFSRLRQEAPDAAHTFYFFILAEKEGMETSLLRYLILALRHGNKVNGNLADAAVRDIITVARKAQRELHRFKGILRFEKLRDGAYLAKMEPDHNILQPLAGYFSSRLRAEDWFIYDVRRRTAARWHSGTLRLGTIEQFTAPALSEDELRIQALWQTFFRTIAIPDRKNFRLQKSNMPMKYWRYLTEKQEL